MSELGMLALLLKPMATHPGSLESDMVISMVLPVMVQFAEKSPEEKQGVSCSLTAGGAQQVLCAPANSVSVHSAAAQLGVPATGTEVPPQLLPAVMPSA